MWLAAYENGVMKSWRYGEMAAEMKCGNIESSEMAGRQKKCKRNEEKIVINNES